MAFNCDLLLFRARGSAYHNHDWAFASLTPSTFIAREPPLKSCLFFGAHRDPGGSRPSFSFYPKSFFTLKAGGTLFGVACRLLLFLCRASLLAWERLAESAVQLFLFRVALGFGSDRTGGLFWLKCDCIQISAQVWIWISRRCKLKRDTRSRVSKTYHCALTHSIY